MLNTKITDLSLWDIASWQVDLSDQSKKELIKEPEWHAGLPSLQRGAVWKANQVEILWDSILRGFPIGSLLLTKVIKEQIIEKQKTDSDQITHHILDGQQRCNAIAWGFDLPDEKTPKSMLWFDLACFIKSGQELPKGYGDYLSEKSSRKYLFRLTTSAHPWGYDKTDNAGRLSAGQIYAFVDAFENIYGIKDNSRQWMTVNNSIPWDAQFPIPFGLLLQNITFKEGKIKINWNAIKNHSWIEVIDQWLSKKYKQSKLISNFIENQLDKDELKNSLKGLLKTRIPAIELQRPEDSGASNPIEDIELIFSRLNNQGTPIRPEELQYSAIKAYFPDVQKSIQEVEENEDNKSYGLPVGEARLVLLGVSAALFLDPDPLLDKYNTIPTKMIEQIRNWFKQDSPEKKCIKEYFGQGEKNALNKAVNWIEANLVYHKENNTLGIPPYLRSSIAWNSEDIYLWWMLLADRFTFKSIPNETVKKILAISTTIHWFGFKNNGLAKCLINKTINNSETDLNETLREITLASLVEGKNQLLKIIVPPINVEKEAFEDILKNRVKIAFENAKDASKKIITDPSHFFNSLTDHGLRENEKMTEGDSKYDNFLRQVWKKTELLVYIQRDALSDYGYDPSNQSLWAAHNRPWDYDHILPQSTFYGTGTPKEKFADGYYICSTLNQSIGNQMALDLSANRSKGMELPKFDDPIVSNAIFLDLDNTKIDEAEMRERWTNAFSLHWELFRKENSNGLNENCEVNCRKYADAVVERLIRIYQIWFEELEVKKFIGINNYQN